MVQPKQAWMLKLLEDAWVSVYLDPRLEGVALPNFLREDTHVVLQYGYRMPTPIPDLHIDEIGISATLSFHHVPYKTFVPWSAIFSISDGEERMQIWPKDLPSDLELLLHPTGIPSSEKTSAKEGAKTPESSISKKQRPTHLKLVD